MVAVEVLFWVAAALTVYTMAGYPLLALILAWLVDRKVARQAVTPSVSLIIAAYNEEKVIGEKIRQSLQLDYPRDRLEIMVASDGSTDRTDAIVESFADQGVRLYRSGGRKGKTGMLNGAVGAASGDILVFSDATGVYNSEAIRELAANFADPSVGCVTGRVAYSYADAVTARGFRGYQRIAVAIRQAESRFGSQTSVSGSIHAMRRSLFRPADPAFTLDVVDAVHAVAQGYRVVYEAGAVALEESRTRARDEFRCRVRIGIRVTSMIPYIIRELLVNRRLGYLFQVVSHKMLRWWLWLLLLMLLVSNLLLIGRGWFYQVSAAVQIAFYAAAAAGLALGTRGIRIPLVNTASFFLLGNAAMAVGAVKGILGRRMPSWEPIREPETCARREC